MIFVVRASLDADGLLRGVVTQSGSGRKEQFEGSVELGDVVAAMAGREPDSETGLARLGKSGS